MDKLLDSFKSKVIQTLSSFADGLQKNGNEHLLFSSQVLVCNICDQAHLNDSYNYLSSMMMDLKKLEMEYVKEFTLKEQSKEGSTLRYFPKGILKKLSHFNILMKYR